MSASPTDLAAVFDRAADTYDIAAFPFFTAFGEALVEFAGIGPDERVLDVGCGAGAALAPAAQRARQAVGVELSPAMAERARAAAPAAEVLVGDAARLNFDDDSFDVVLSAFVVFFMPDPTAALREWQRVLRPSGRVALSTWGGADPRWDWERELRREFIGEISKARLEEMARGLELLNRFDAPGKIEDELRGGGFQPEEVREHALEFVFRDEQAWWDWNWSHGTRIVLEALSEEARDRYRERGFEAMQACRQADGFPRRYTALFARGVAA